jgi:hypothetical protein
LNFCAVIGLPFLGELVVEEGGEEGAFEGTARDERASCGFDVLLDSGLALPERVGGFVGDLKGVEDVGAKKVIGNDTADVAGGGGFTEKLVEMGLEIWVLKEGVHIDAVETVLERVKEIFNGANVVAGADVNGRKGLEGEF